MDITDDFKIAMYERMATPLFVTLIISWSIWNYDILLHLFADYGSVTRKIEAIEGVTQDWCRVYGWPLLMTGVTVVVYPWLSAGVFWLNCLANKWKETKRTATEDDTQKKRERVSRT